MVLDDIIRIRIGGEIGKYNTLPVDYLAELATQLQKLIRDIAHLDLPLIEPVDLNNFKLELSGFGKGSAVPVFEYTKRIQHTTISGIYDQRQKVKEKFEELMVISSEGKYSELTIIYKEPEKRNAITNSLFNFVSSLRDAPAEIVDETNKSIYKITPFKKQVRDAILTSIMDIKNAEDSTIKVVQLAKVEVTKKGKGIKDRTKVLELYDKKYNHVEFAPDIINCIKNIYKLRFPLMCSMDIQDGNTSIENHILGIYAHGSTPDEAEAMFNEEFDYIYNRYNSVKDSKLTEDVKAIKTLLNHIVVK